MRYQKAKPVKCCVENSRIERVADPAKGEAATAAKNRAQSTAIAESGRIRFVDQESAQ